MVPFLSIVLPPTGLTVTALITDDGSADRTATAWTASVVTVMLAWFAVAVWVHAGGRPPRSRPVFPARRSFRIAAALFGTAVALTAVLIVDDPFGHLLREMRIAAPDLAHVGLLVATIVALVAGGAACVDAVDQRKAERAWPDHLPS